MSLGGRGETSDAPLKPVGSVEGPALFSGGVLVVGGCEPGK